MAKETTVARESGVKSLNALGVSRGRGDSRRNTAVIKPYKSAKGFNSITGLNYYAATENKIKARLNQLEGMSGDVRTHTGFFVETVRNALNARLNDIKSLNKKNQK